ncbi:MAG: NAD(P)-dependent oxidoreductase [Halopseudomonas aestusnigri]
MLKSKTIGKQYSVPFSSTPDSLHDQGNDQSDLAISLIWMVSQRIKEGQSLVQSDSTTDIWSELCPTNLIRNELRGKILGIIGLNSAGQDVAKRAHQEFGMRIIAYGPCAFTNEGLTACNVETTHFIDDLLTNSDYVLLNDAYQTTDNSTTYANDHYLIDSKRLNLMKPSACLINIAQSAAVDPHALMQALWFETISGAGLAIDNDETSLQLHNLAHSQLEFRNCDNCVLLPRPQ